MVVVQPPWRPWTATDSHAKEDRAICEEGQAQPQRGPSSRSMQMVTTQGLERQESKEPTPGPEEEEQCRRSRHHSGGTGVPSKQDSSRRTGVVLEGPPVQYSMKKVLSGERAGAASLATL